LQKSPVENQGPLPLENKNLSIYFLSAEMENPEQGDRSTVDRRGDTKAESSTVIIKA
jgi:hypothetical protein